MPERLTLHITTGNDAFVDSPTGEIARILRNYARALERGTIDPGYTPLMDLNGNHVGEAQINSIGDDDDCSA